LEDAEMPGVEILDLTMDDATPTSEVVDLTMDVGETEVVEIEDSDVEMANEPDAASPQVQTDMRTRRTIQSWAGSYCPENWITSRQDFHTSQVDPDPALAAEVSEHDYPVFVQ
jgi:hypothetical protein